MALRFDYASRLYLLRNGGKEASGTGSFRLGSLPALAGQPHIPHIVQGKSDLFEALRQNLPWGYLRAREISSPVSTRTNGLWLTVQQATEQGFRVELTGTTEGKQSSIENLMSFAPAS